MNIDISTTTISQTILWLALIYMCSSCLIYMYVIYTGRDLEQRPIYNIKSYPLLVGVWLAIGFFFGFIFYKALFFIPSTWGDIDKTGDWVSARHYLANMTAFIASLGIVIKLDKLHKKRILHKKITTK